MPISKLMHCLIFINVHAQIICFSDDTVILCQEKNEDQLYKKASLTFKTVKLWFNNLDKSINVDTQNTAKKK